jgi:hypothetical protein
MKSDFWLFSIMHSFDKVRTLRIEKRTLIILAVGGIVFAVGLAYFGYQYFSLLQGESHLIDELNRLKSQVSVLDQKLKKVSMENRAPKPVPPPIAIEELKVIRPENRDGFSVRFRLINRNPRDMLISGTLVMVAKNENPPPPIYRVIPEMSLDRGIPQQPEKGIRFEIRRQKFVEAFFDASTEEVFSTVTVYLYSPDRKLILQKSLEIP